MTHLLNNITIILLILFVSFKIEAQESTELIRIDYHGHSNIMRMPPIYIFSENSCLNFDFVHDQTFGSKSSLRDVLIQRTTFILSNNNFKKYKNKIDTLVTKYAENFDKESDSCYQCIFITHHTNNNKKVQVIKIFKNDSFELTKNIINFYNELNAFVKALSSNNYFPKNVQLIIEQQVNFLEMTFGKKILNKDPLKIGDVIKCPTISHRIGGGSLNENSIDSVKIIANIIKDNPKFIFEISYHTDHRGASHSNLELSEKHSDFLRLYLIEEHNIEPERIIAKGYGEANPIIPVTEIDNANDEEKESLYAINRRYELKVIEEINND
jgi:outer membrane protein OmpA-like peptidoglycan-associated protein